MNNYHVFFSINKEQSGALNDMVGMYKTELEAKDRLDELINISIKKYGRDEKNPQISYKILEAQSNTTIKKCTLEFLMAKEFYNWV